jgi:hypothetical protein
MASRQGGAVVSHPQALNEEQILQLMTDAIPTIARRLEHNEGWAFLMKQANHVKELKAENARLKTEVERLTVILEAENDVAQRAAEIIIGRIEDAVKEVRADIEAAAKEGNQP